MSVTNYLEFFKIVGKLKTLKRTGWVRNGIILPESVSDHMYRMGMMGLCLDNDIKANDGSLIDKMKCIKMSLVHDLGESIVGDFTPDDKITNQEKHDLEKNAMIEITNNLSKPVAQEILNLWQEYEENTTNEAKLVKDFDKFEMIVQAFEYEKQQPEKKLDSFFNSTRGRFTHPLFKELALKLEQERNDFHNNKKVE
ncbi:hypothetical protein CYY_004350 [Polysphondylium violaceum]|uniref:5'-deoxynucleotidase n=1 Tax=Polysphondylium violaceum TaxID=133409 RepID=A0A8J4PX56_9MYCE|nr:hypothetical protein CYY_004350 [Polysphondylium violaceum]